MFVSHLTRWSPILRRSHRWVRRVLEWWSHFPAVGFRRTTGNRVVSMATSAEIGQSTVPVDFHGDHSTPAVLSHLKHFRKWVIKVYKSSSIKIMTYLDIPRTDERSWSFVWEFGRFDGHLILSIKCQRDKDVTFAQIYLKYSINQELLKHLKRMTHVNIFTDTKLTAVIIGRHIEWGAVGVPLAGVFGDGCLAISSRLGWRWAVAIRHCTLRGWMQTEEERIEDTWWSIFQLTLWVK